MTRWLGRCCLIASLCTANASAVATFADAPPASTAPATTRPIDPDVALVRAAIVKSMPTVKMADLTAKRTIESLGGRDIDVVLIVGEIGAQLGTSVDDAAVDRAVDGTPTKTMRGLTVLDLVRLARQTRAAM